MDCLGPSWMTRFSVATSRPSQHSRFVLFFDLIFPEFYRWMCWIASVSCISSAAPRFSQLARFFTPLSAGPRPSWSSLFCGEAAVGCEIFNQWVGEIQLRRNWEIECRCCSWLAASWEVALEGLLGLNLDDYWRGRSGAYRIQISFWKEISLAEHEFEETSSEPGRNLGGTFVIWENPYLNSKGLHLWCLSSIPLIFQF